MCQVNIEQVPGASNSSLRFTPGETEVNKDLIKLLREMLRQVWRTLICEHGSYKAEDVSTYSRWHWGSWVVLTKTNQFTSENLEGKAILLLVCLEM